MRLASLALLTLALLAATPLHAACPPKGHDRNALTALAGAEWKVDDAGKRQSLALALVDCLASPDPVLRDGLAMEALSHWLRAGLLDTDTVHTLGRRLTAQLSKPADAAGFRQPFAALALAEVARVDRLAPFYTPAEREALLATACDWLIRLEDRRGFDERQGWRHGVAHGADLLMQLALNPALDRAQLDRILAAVAAQTVPDTTHFYIHGEGERLVRPVLFVAQRGLHPPEFWAAWFAGLAQSATPAEGAAMTQRILARQHNLKALLWPLLATVAESKDEKLKSSLMPALTETLKNL